jgi:exosortase H (IPTLxxWG-CTERM-specific)
MPSRNRQGDGARQRRCAAAKPTAQRQPGGLSAWLAGKRPVLRFVVGFTALMGLYYVLVLTPFCDRLLYSYLQANAWASGAILNALGQDCRVLDVTIRSAHFAIALQRGCDAVEPAWFFCAAVVAFPGESRRKIPGMLVGISLLFALNLVRIVSLFFIGWRFPAFFGVAHLELWPAFFILSALVSWISWVRWTWRAPLEDHHVAT